MMVVRTHVHGIDHNTTRELVLDSDVKVLNHRQPCPLRLHPLGGSAIAKGRVKERTQRHCWVAYRPIECGGNSAIGTVYRIGCEKSLLVEKYGWTGVSVIHNAVGASQNSVWRRRIGKPESRPESFVPSVGKLALAAASGSAAGKNQ